MRILITGVTGFVGSHLAEAALAQGHDVFGASRGRHHAEHVRNCTGRLNLLRADLGDAEAVHALLGQCDPGWIVHLAGQTQVLDSWKAPVETLAANAIGLVHLLEAVRHRSPPHPRVLIVGSSEEYGAVREDELPVTEDTPLRPLSPYAVSKVTQDLLGYQYFHSYGIPCLRVRAFNHEGPRRGESFVTSAFARQIAEIEQGHREPVLHVGNLQARRDYTDVRDVARGYLLLLERGTPGEVYNLCSGRGWSIREILDHLLALATLRPIEIREDPDRLRPAEVSHLVGNARRLREATGWTPAVPFEQTLREVLDYWRARVKASA